MTENQHIINLQHITKSFGGKKVLDDINLYVRKGEFLTLLGPSGCGKTTCGRTCLGMYNKTDGQVLYRGKDVHALKGSELFAYKKEAQMVFQDPFSSLDPRETVMQLISEPIIEHKLIKGKEAIEERTLELMRTVGLAERYANVYPHELDGGRRQRVGIARALALNPDFIVCDEPVSALDVSIQAQILNLLQDLRKKRGLSFLFIAHDLKVSCWFCDTIGVMYRGMLVEEGPAKDMYKDAVHPYTQALFAGAGGNYKIEKNGEMNTLLEFPKGCPYAHRCSRASEKCREEIPEWKEVSEGHKIRCFNA